MKKYLLVMLAGIVLFSNPSMTVERSELFEKNDVSIKGAVKKCIYICPDDHSDLMWQADTSEYREVMLKMLDYYLDLADSTEINLPEFQSRWNCDGSIWMWFYEQNRTPEQFQRLINRIKDGHISVMKTFENACYGGMPTEAVLRELYYAGSLQRRYNISFPMAMSQENQTLPLGLASLWAGAGIKYSWRGVCSCATRVPESGNREHQMYWWTGLDGGKILMKWYSMPENNKSLGGYAEARDPYHAVELCDSLCYTPGYPYGIAAAFGYGWDNVSSFTNEFIKAAEQKNTENRQVIVSNEIDFFQDFERAYGDRLPEVSVSFGNDWDVLPASMSEVTAATKRAVEKLRTAEAMATLVSLKKADFMLPFTREARQAWANLPLYWEHDWTADSPIIPREQRAEWSRGLSRQIQSYVNTLHDSARSELGGIINKPDNKKRFFVFNSLNWPRTGIADLQFENLKPVSVYDVTTGEIVPSQAIQNKSGLVLRILAENVPAVGYKVYEIRTNENNSFAGPLTANPETGIMENRFYKIKVSGNGAITSLVDKSRNNREFVRAINGSAINDLGPGNGTLAVENAGPVSITLKATAAEPLMHTTRITLYRNSDRIDIANEIRQNFGDTQTWSFCFNLQPPDVWHEEIGAVIRAKLESDGGFYSDRIGNCRYDWLTLNHFADMSGADGSGITLSNRDCCFMQLGNSAYSVLDTETPQIKVLAGGQVTSEKLGIKDQGDDSYFLQRFALRTHNVFDKVNAMRFALEHQNPMTSGRITGGRDYPADQFSLLDISDPDVILWALKPHEDGIRDAGIVTRVWNLGDNESKFDIHIKNGSLKSGQQLTHDETPVQPAVTDGNTLKASAASQQMRTYGIKMSTIEK